MPDSEKTAMLLDELAALAPVQRRKVATLLKNVSETFAEVPDGKTARMSSACSPTYSSRTDLSRNRSVPGQASVPSTQLCFPTTCCPESMSR